MTQPLPHIVILSVAEGSILDRSKRACCHDSSARTPFASRQAFIKSFPVSRYCWIDPSATLGMTGKRNGNNRQACFPLLLSMRLRRISIRRYRATLLQGSTHVRLAQQIESYPQHLKTIQPPYGRGKQANQPSAEEIHPLCLRASPPAGAM